jgi:hypothetical protein
MEQPILGARTELARHLKLDPRHTILNRFKPVAYEQAGGKRIALYAIDSALSPVKLADYQRVNRASASNKISLTRSLSQRYGEGWLAKIESLMF